MEGYECATDNWQRTNKSVTELPSILLCLADTEMIESKTMAKSRISQLSMQRHGPVQITNDSV